MQARMVARLLRESLGETHLASKEIEKVVSDVCPELPVPPRMSKEVQGRIKEYASRGLPCVVVWGPKGWRIYSLEGYKTAQDTMKQNVTKLHASHKKSNHNHVHSR